MYINTLNNPSFFDLLIKIDQDIINKVAFNSCPFCSGKLNRSDYQRKPRGGPEGLDKAFSTRFSLCCREEGCRKRVTPRSVRFLDRRVWLGSVIIIACILKGDCQPDSFRKFCTSLRLAPKTVSRWRRWWQESFSKDQFWQALRGRLASPIAAAKLPTSLLKIFEDLHGKVELALIACLKLLSYQFI